MNSFIKEMMTPLDFALRGMLKERVYARNPSTIPEHSERIIEEQVTILNGDLSLMSRLCRSITKRCPKCVEIKGDYFVHLI